MQQVIDLAFEHLGVDVFGLQVDVDNYAAFLCFERCGLECVDQGRYRSLECYRMEICREAWEGVSFAELIPEHDDHETPVAPDEAPGLRSWSPDAIGEESNPYLTAKLLAPLKELVSDR